MIVSEFDSTRKLILIHIKKKKSGHPSKGFHLEDKKMIPIRSEIENNGLTFLSKNIVMLKNFIKIAWRNLIRNRTFSIINIVGLSFSVAFCLLLFFYIRKEQSYDNFSENKN